MTCLDIITDAMRELGVLGIGKDPKASEADYGLTRLQRIVDGMFGNGVGLSLAEVEIDGTADLAADTRNLCSLTTAATLTLPDSPKSGARIQVKDMLGNFASHNVTLDGNGRLIEGTATKALNTNSTDTTWVYVGDSANWVKVQTLALTDPLALGDDDFFTLALAKRMAPAFGAKFTSEDALLRAANRIRARFPSKAIVPADDAVLFLGRQSFGCSFTGL